MKITYETLYLNQPLTYIILAALVFFCVISCRFCNLENGEYLNGRYSSFDVTSRGRQFVSAVSSVGGRRKDSTQKEKKKVRQVEVIEGVRVSQVV